MTWWAAAPAVLVAVALLLLPGVVLTRVAAVRGVLLVAAAPALSVAVLGASAVLASLIGVRWSVMVVAAGTVIAAGVLALLRLALTRLGPWRRDAGVRRGGLERGRPGGDGVGGWLAAGVGVLAGGLSLGVGLVRGVGPVTTWPQSFDAVFHLSATWHVLRTGDGSSLTMGTVARPTAERSFYPGAWHDVTALVADLAGVPVVVAANAVSMAVLALLGPLGAIALTRVALGSRPVALLAAGALTAGITASPVMLSSYGTLWPNALGTALLPGVLALVVVVLRASPAATAPVTRSAALVLGGAGAVGLALAHPNGVVSLLVVSAVVAVVVAWPRGGVARWLAVSSVPVLVWLIGWSPVFASSRRTSWPARQSIAQAAGEWLLLAPQRVPLPLLLAALSIIGLVLAVRSPPLRWLAAAHLVNGALFALVAGSDSRWARLASGPWFDDAFRLGALCGLGAVPLAALACDRVVQGLAGRWGALRARSMVLRQGILAASGAVLLVVLTGGLYQSETARVVGTWYGSTALVPPAAARVLQDLGASVPEGAVVAGNPFDGAALSGVLGGRQALFPHLNGVWGPDRMLVAGHLAQAQRRPEVCAAVRRLGVTHVLTGQARFWRTDRRRTVFEGLDVAGAPGFAAVDRAGGMTLWRITACA